MLNKQTTNVADQTLNFTATNTMVMRPFTAASVRSALVEKFRQAYLCVPRVRTELGENELSSTSLELEWESVHTGLTTPMAVAGKGFHLRLSLIFRTISKKSMQLGSPNLTQIYSTMSPGNPLIFGVKRSKVKVRSHKNIAGVGVCTLVSAGFFWLLSNDCIARVQSPCCCTKYNRHPSGSSVPHTPRPTQPPTR